MYPILILRAEVICLTVLIFLLFISKSYEINKSSYSFGKLIFFAIAHVVFDIVTVITVNHVDTLPKILNWIAHVIFYITAILFSNEIANYAVKICYPKKAKRFYHLGLSLTAIYVCCLPFLKIDYIKVINGGTWSSTGLGAFVGYGLAFVFFASALVILFVNYKKLSSSVKATLIPMMVVLIIVELAQVMVKSLLFTGAAITIVTLGFFFSLENPAMVFQKIAMTDALTGVQSRSSYISDLEKLEKKFAVKPNDDYTFVFCDICNLRDVNNKFGHAEGDNYITFIASTLTKNMVNANGIYRIGGDEFLAYYYKTKDDVITSELQAIFKDCEEAKEKFNYVPAVSVGYAKSSESYKTLSDVVKIADFEMYRNKTIYKKNNANTNAPVGTKINYSGLTDKVFDAICSSNETNYPFITNLDTGVTRISPLWKEVFGLDSEFYIDFFKIWCERIYDEDIEGFKSDIAAVVTETKKYHDCTYRVKTTSGKYISVSGHGSIYRDAVDNCNYFAGYITNLSLQSDVDKVTGLRRFNQAYDCVCEHIDNKKPFSILKLKINNFARVNMLYGYSGGNEVIKRISEIFVEEIGDIGEVFCHNAVNLSILFETADADVVKTYYDKLSSRLAYGVDALGKFVPIIISGGAILNNGEFVPVEDIRRGLIYSLEESVYAQRGELVFYEPKTEKEYSTDFELLAEIHTDALMDMKYFKLRYQPIIDIASGKIISAEALLRWVHPEHGEIPPSKYIAFLENDPCYYKLGLQILVNAVSDAKKILEIIPDFKINVNITALQLRNEAFLGHVLEILKQNEVKPGALVLELTERCKEMDSKFLAKTIGEIRKAGILVAFDDLGTGYSTINLLMDIPVDEIKLDRDFVRELQNRTSYQTFVKSLVLGSSMNGSGYNICFEGIENKEMLDFVGSFGDFYVQGYYFAKPLLFEDFVKYVEENL